MRITKTGTYVMTAIAAALFVFLTWAFDDGRFALNDTGILFEQDGAIIDGTIWTYVMLALIIGAGLFQATRIPDEGVELRPGGDVDTPGQTQDPSLWRLLVGNAHLALLWLPLRFYIGRSWLAAGEHKVTEDAWMDGGAALEGYWTNATAGGAEGTGTALYPWYNDFLGYMLDNGWASWFGPIIAVGEVLVGLGLLVGGLVGIAAFFGTVLNFSFMLAGTLSSNPVMFGLTVFIILGWKVAGWWGLDRWLLPALGTPWFRGEMLGSKVRNGTNATGETSQYA